MEDPISMRNNAQDKLNRAREFALQPDRKVMALGFAQAAKLIFLQLDDQVGVQDASEIVGRIETEAAQEKAAIYARERQQLEEAAVRWGTATPEEAAVENTTRLQTGIWLAFEKSVGLPVWHGEGEASPLRKYNPKIENLEVDAAVKRILQLQDVESVEVLEIQRAFKQAYSWIFKARIKTPWGKRSFLLCA